MEKVESTFFNDEDEDEEEEEEDDNVNLEDSENDVDMSAKNMNRIVYNDANLDFDNSVGRSIKILPDKDYEGFFVCLLKKVNKIF